MIQYHYHHLIHLNEDDLKIHRADSAPFNWHLSILSSAQAKKTKIEIMHAGQFHGARRKRPTFPFANSITGAFLSGVHPKNPTSMFVTAVTHTA